MAQRKTPLTIDNRPALRAIAYKSALRFYGLRLPTQYLDDIASDAYVTLYEHSDPDEEIIFQTVGRLTRKTCRTLKAEISADYVAPNGEAEPDYYFQFSEMVRHMTRDRQIDICYARQLIRGLSGVDDEVLEHMIDLGNPISFARETEKSLGESVDRFNALRDVATNLEEQNETKT